MHAAGLLDQRFFQRKYKMADEVSHSTDSSVARNEGHSDPLKVTVEAAARLRLAFSMGRIHN